MSLHLHVPTEPARPACATLHSLCDDIRARAAELDALLFSPEATTAQLIRHADGVAGAALAFLNAVPQR